MNSISRFELGKAVPTDFNVLGSLERAARYQGLIEESRLFSEAQAAIRFNAYRRPDLAAETTTAPRYTPQEWRLMHAARIAIRLYPESARAIEKAAGPALALVDEILLSADAAVLGPLFYTELEKRLNELADRQAFEALKQERNK
jgi:hypothetical protein